MPLNFTNTSDRQHSGITALIYGPPGCGKTFFLGKLPGKTLLLDIDGGSSVLADAAMDMQTIPRTLDNLVEILAYLDSPDFPYDNIALDSATELYMAMLIKFGAEGNNDGVPCQADYQRAQFKMRDVMRTLRDMRARNINVIVTALEMREVVEQAEGLAKSEIMPSMSRKIAPEICGLFDIVAHMEISQKEESRGRRFFRMFPNGDMQAKDRIWNRQYCLAEGPDLIVPPTPTKDEE